MTFYISFINQLEYPDYIQVNNKNQQIDDHIGGKFSFVYVLDGDFS
ncbi:hypothetical protein ACP6PL_13915 [Dapis sp. BLCC M126]